jgi:hypothetical protein
MAIITLNPSDKTVYTELSNGNLSANSADNYRLAYQCCRATIGKLGGGRWYFECKIDLFKSLTYFGVGLISKGHSLADVALGGDVSSHAVGSGVSRDRILRHKKFPNTTSTGVNSYLPSVLVQGDRVSVAYDLNGTGSVWYAVNGVWIGGGTPGVDATPAVTGLFGVNIGGWTPLYPAIALSGGILVQESYGEITVGFADDDFFYTPPSGFLSVENPTYDFIRGDSGENVTSGTGVITGTITEREVPGSYQVQAYDQATGQLCATTWSDPVTGAYSFSQLSTERDFFVIAFDHTEPIRHVPEAVDRVRAS